MKLCFFVLCNNRSWANYQRSVNPYGLVLGSDHALWGQTCFAGQIVRVSI